MNEKEKTLYDLLKKHLEQFPLYKQEHEVRAHTFNDGVIWLGYKTEQGIPRQTTHFDLNITDSICYLLDIELEREQRGKNNGKSLYKIIENFAREAGCKAVRQTPSDWTKAGKTREEYLLNLGYKKIPDSIEVEKIL